MGEPPYGVFEAMSFKDMQQEPRAGFFERITYAELLAELDEIIACVSAFELTRRSRKKRKKPSTSPTPPHTPSPTPPRMHLKSGKEASDKKWKERQRKKLKKLRAELESSQEERQELKDARLCAICFESIKNCLFTCGHHVRFLSFGMICILRLLEPSRSAGSRQPVFIQACRGCADTLPDQLCHICRAPIISKHTIYDS